MRACISAVIGIAAAYSSFAAPADRIRGTIDDSRMVRLQGTIQPMARAENERGIVDASQIINGISLDLRPTDAQQNELEAFLEDQRNPSSPDYQSWLTPQQFADRFGASANDVAKIVAWLQAEGFTIDHIGSARTWILFSGSAEQAGRTFHTTLRHYLANGMMHYANDSAPSIPEALGDIVSSIRGLDDFRPQPLAAHPQRAQPELIRGSYHYLSPPDVATIYDVNPLYQAGADGTGQKLAIAGQTDINLLDIQEFRGLFNLPANNPQIVVVGSDPGTSPGDLIEADLDLEWSGAVARNATIIYVNSNNVFTSLQYAIDENLAPVVSVSYGSCEFGAPTSARTLAQQASAEGITWMNASGDQGAAGCDYGATVASNGPAVIFPADIPEVVAVGGTEFDEAGSQGWSSASTGGMALEYIPETAWNDTSSGNPIEASGGGASTIFSKPWWQTGPGVPNDNARDVPDVALAASAQHDQYLIVTSDTLMSIGGTSAASPSFAGMVTLIGQYLLAKGTLKQPGLGNINPTLYALARTSTNIFHDITTGNNIVPCSEGSPGCTNGSFGYNAGPGYDLVTGLGSIDAYNLATDWSSVQTGIGVTIKVTASSASITPSASVQVTATVTPVSGTNPPTGTVVFSLGGTAIGSEPLTLGTSTSSATITVRGSALSSGANLISADYLATGTFLGSTGAVTVAVASPGSVATTTTVSANPATIASTLSTTLTATVKAASGNASPTGTVTFAVGGTALGSVALAGSTASLSINASGLTIGNNTITATYSATGNFSNSTGSVKISVTASPVATTTTAAANPASIVSTGSTVVTATIKAASGTAAPTGTVTFLLGSTTLGTEPISASMATITIKGSNLNIGNNTITATYSAAGNSTGSVGSVTIAVTAPPVSTSTTVTANPGSILSTGSTVVTATLKGAGGTASPTGTVTFQLGSTTLGTVPVSGAAASITIFGSNLAIGTNKITANYTATGNFANSTGSATVAVTVATTTTITASPASISSAASTLLTATVEPVSGTAAETGTVAFLLGDKTLGTTPISGSTASLTVKGSGLSVGSNTITAKYVPTGDFSGSTGSVTVAVTAPPVATAMTVLANPSSIAASASTVLTATVKAASGSNAPAGTVTFTLGSATLGSATISGATASLTVKGSGLVAGKNTITAAYAGNSSFTASSATVTVTVTGSASTSK